jgi:hypothetical protein
VLNEWMVENMMKDATQFSINMGLKTKLDALKVEKRDDILTRYKVRKRFVSNTMVIQYLYDEFKGSQKRKKE